MNVVKLFEIYRRQCEGQKITKISYFENVDRKTIRIYLNTDFHVKPKRHLVS